MKVRYKLSDWVVSVCSSVLMIKKWGWSFCLPGFLFSSIRFLLKANFGTMQSSILYVPWNFLQVSSITHTMFHSKQPKWDLLLSACLDHKYQTQEIVHHIDNQSKTFIKHQIFAKHNIGLQIKLQRNSSTWLLRLKNLSGHKINQSF